MRTIRVAVHAKDPLDAAGLTATVERHGLLMTRDDADVLLVSGPFEGVPGTPVVLVTDEEPDAAALSSAVVCAVPREAAAGERFVALLRAAAAGQSWRDPEGNHLAELFRSLSVRPAHRRLPEPDLHLLRLAADGLTNAEISAATGRSPRSVRLAFDDIVVRMHVRNVRHAIADAIRSGQL